MRPLDTIGASTLYEYLTGDPWGPCPLFARALAVLRASPDADGVPVPCHIEWPTYTAEDGTVRPM